MLSFHEEEREQRTPKRGQRTEANKAKRTEKGEDKGAERKGQIEARTKRGKIKEESGMGKTTK